MINWLFNITVLPEEDSLHIGWLAPWPLWIWIIAVVVIVLFVIWCYRGVSAPKNICKTLAATRGIILLFVAILLNGPVLESSRDSTISDQVIILLDRSASMQVEDLEIDQGDKKARRSRDEQLQELLSNIKPFISQADTEREVRWFGFHSHAFELPTSTNEILPQLNEPTGDRTRIDQSIARTIAMANRGPVSSIVLFTDGRSEQDLQTGILSRIREEGIPIIAVPLGSQDAVGDLVLDQVRAPETAYLKDQIPVTVSVDRIGITSTPFDVVLRNRDTDEILDRKTIPAGSDSQVQTTLLGVPERGGSVTWSVTIEPEQPDLVLENNRADVDITLLDDPLRVLYIEGGPRWEYRYLKNLLVREDSIESSIMLLSADNTFAQEGDRPLARLPISEEEFDEFDVVIIGDVPAGIMSPEQHHHLTEAVSERGTGILWIAGEMSTPRSWAQSELIETLPFSGPYELPAIGSPIQVQSTREADRIGVLQLSDNLSSGWPRSLQDEQTDWSKLQWSQWIQEKQLKPTTSVLAETIRIRDQDQPIPLVMAMRFGTGRSIYVTTDEIWRWRYGRGEKLGEQFWIQLIRHLGRSSLSASRGPAELLPSRRQIPVGDIVTLRLTIFDDDILTGAPESISVQARDEDDRLAANLSLQRSPDDRDTWLGSWLPGRAGSYQLAVDLSGNPVETRIRVDDTTREYQNPETDHQSLESLVEWSSGHLLPPDQIQNLPDLLPDRSIVETEVRRAGLWDAPIIFIVLILLLTLEWLCRRLVRLA